MGYYTRFELEIGHGEDYNIDYEQEISNTTDYEHCFDNEIKWYDHNEDMIAYSKTKPDTLFILHGEGEESGDIWKSYFKNGKMKRHNAKITFDEYNEDLLE